MLIGNHSGCPKVSAHIAEKPTLPMLMGKASMLLMERENIRLRAPETHVFSVLFNSLIVFASSLLRVGSLTGAA